MKTVTKHNLSTVRIQNGELLSATDKHDIAEARKRIAAGEFEMFSCAEELQKIAKKIKSQENQYV